jgi:hypothetical protein
MVFFAKPASRNESIPGRIRMVEKLNNGPLINREYKDDLFRFIFNDSKALLKLYNALNGTNYHDEQKLEINTLTDVIYLKYKNDLSFIIGSTINLYESQSTINPNMPLRGLRYIAMLYNKEIGNNKKIYGTTLVRIPYPQCIVFYSGKNFQEERKILRLSDAYFEIPDCKYEPCLEFTVTVLNINFGNNKELLKQCYELEGYAFLIHQARENERQGMDYHDASEAAIDKCIEIDMLKDFLLKHRAEVLDYMLTEYNEEIHYQVIREEGFEEGFAEADEKWRMFVAEKDAVIKELQAKLNLN